MTAIDVTREKLYEQVWREPMMQLAKRYGVSISILSKTCRLLDVPVPTRGHWIKLQHGKANLQPPLPPAAPISAQCADIAAVPKNVLAVIERIGSKAGTEHRIVVGKRLDNPHPAVRATAAALSGVEPDQYGLVWPPSQPAPLCVRVSAA